MKVFKVIDTLKIGDNTSIIINDKGSEIKNGVGILDEYGKPYVVLSVGMNNNKGRMDTTTLLIEGAFNSSKIFL
jgi:hypothetical protein